MENLIVDLRSLPNDIAPFYPEEPRLRKLLFTHSNAVASKALSICNAHPELGADRDFVFRASQLHDIGIVSCDAPGIFCFGTLPYICHGVEGARMLGQEGMLAEARVCERHTGSGITAEEIASQALPLPPRDMLPVTIEEKIICYADKFYSKNPEKLTSEKPLSKIIKEMSRFGQASLCRFLRLHNLLS